MRARIDQQILFIHADDVPTYRKKGSVVRNTYFWALRSIADRAEFDKEWEFADIVWPALCRMLQSFGESGYLYYSETCLEFPPDADLPSELQSVSTWAQDELAADD